MGSESTLASSTTESSSSSTVPTASTQNGASFSVPNITIFVTVRLADNNYLLWHKQISSFLVGQKLWQFVDGSFPQPDPFLPAKEGVAPVANPDHDSWRCTDQSLESMIGATLSDPILAMVIGCQTAKETWDCLQRHYAQRSIANAQNIRFQLFGISKGTKSISDYLQHAKSLSDSLASIDEAVSSKDLVSSILRGLGPDYQMLVTVILNTFPLPAFEDLRARLLAFEDQILTPLAPSAPVQTALLASQTTGQSTGFSRQPNGHGHFGLNQGFFNPNVGNQNTRGRRGRGNRNNNSGNWNRNSRIVCQLCNAPGHSAHTCSQWYAATQRPQPMLPSAAFTYAPPSYYTAPHAPSQTESLNTAFAGLQFSNPGYSSQQNPSDVWYPDSGATHHMTGDPRPLQNQVPYTGADHVQLGNGATLPITHSGNIPLQIGSHSFQLRNVYHLPAMTKNLLSVAKFTRDNNVQFTFDSNGFTISDLHSGAPLFQGPCRDGLYPMSLAKAVPLALAATSESSTLWHNRLGHPSNRVMHFLSSNNLLSSNFKFQHKFCKSCALGKSTHLPFEINREHASSPFYLVHSDVWMSPVTSVSGFRYYVLFTDDYSRFTWVYPMRRKSEMPSHFENFLNLIKNQFNTTIKLFQSDGGTEYVNQTVSTLCVKLGIHHRLSCPHTPQQNGLAERKHRHISEMARTLIVTSGVPLNLWFEAVSTAVFLINRLPTSVLQWSSPFSCLYGTLPSYNQLRIFGCACYPYLGDYFTNKLMPKTVECIFLGYSSQHKGYRCLDPTSNRVYVSRHVRFDETTFPFITQRSPSELAESDLVFVPVLTPPPVTSTATPTVSPTLPPPIPVDVAYAAAPTPSPTLPQPNHVRDEVLFQQQYQRRPRVHPNESSNATANATPNPTHCMTTRTRDGSRRTAARTDGTIRYPIPKALTAQLSASTIEPTCYTQAARSPEWRNAMVEEFNALLKNQTWTLVPPSPNQHQVGCKWVFKLKERADGKLERHKARLVAKGFHQQHGLDYDETFSPVVKPTTIRTVLSLAVSSGWPLRQLDVKNAFLHGSLRETVYMTQPPGFVDPNRPHHVCKLHKAIYGLKQAPRAWFQRFSSFLIRCGFTQSRADHSMFVYNHGGQIMVLLLYVDDIVLTGSSSDWLTSFISTLGHEFEIKDLGPLHYFLGIEVTSTSPRTGLHLSQTKYVVDLLRRTNMLECKPCHTPISAKSQLSITDGLPLSDPTEYRQIVGSLQYLNLTRPDISYAVHHVAQFMGTPREPHLLAAKRILRYLKGTLEFGLDFQPSKGPPTLHAFSDADWAGCPDTRRSTSGFCIFLGSNLISWCAKKQPTVSRSSAESEYRALSQLCAETIWIAFLLRELHSPTSVPITLYCDNLSTTYMAANPVFHARTKHIELDYHFVRERVASGTHRVQFVPSLDQTADFFTKGLHKHRFQLLRGSVNQST
ncbi:hypothetical protein ACHQM5_022129 [Ranunculus cassubicifolius]